MNKKDLGRSPSPYKRQSEIPLLNPIPLKWIFNIQKIREHIIKHNSLNTKSKSYESDNNKSS